MTNRASDSGQVGNEEKPFVFVIPVRNPLDRKVKDYGTIEALLEMTVGSLLRQTYPNIGVVIVCHRVPDWAEGYDSRVRFVDVSNDDVFGPDQNPKNIDKGLRFTIGVLYATFAFDPALIMLMDADDYVQVRLAQSLMSSHKSTKDLDCYIIRKGVHAGVHVGRDNRIRYRFAVEVKEFDFTCGSCRIFDAANLSGHLSRIDPGIHDKFADWQDPDEMGCVNVGQERLMWLKRKSEPSEEDRDHIINVLGRHVRQERAFRVRYIDMLLAAKGCGHGNHNGPRKGAVHWYRVTGNMPLASFLETFGLPRQRWSVERVPRLRARLADRLARRPWMDH